MSKVSRSVYQKLKEENKRLLKDIRILTFSATMDERNKTFNKWVNRFRVEREFNQILIEHAKKYIEEHKDELPEFLTSKTK
jgi:hypothetical protein